MRQVGYLQELQINCAGLKEKCFFEFLMSTADVLGIVLIVNTLPPMKRRFVLTHTLRQTEIHSRCASLYNLVNRTNLVHNVFS
jgi:hypothetical protein